MTERLRIFDGHNDSVQRIREYRPDGIDFLARSTDGGARDPDWTVPSHIDLARALDGGLVGGLFAMFVRPEHPPVNDLTVTKNSYEVRLAEPLDTAYAATPDVGTSDCSETPGGTCRRKDSHRLCARRFRGYAKCALQRLAAPQYSGLPGPHRRIDARIRRRG